MITFCLALMSLKPPSHLENSSVCLMPTRRQLCSVSPSVAYPLQFSKRRGYVSNSERGPGADLPTIGRSGDSSRLRPGGDSQRLCRRENLFGMAGNLHLRPDAGDAAVGVDQHCGPRDAHVLPPVLGFLAPHPIGLEYRVRIVRGEQHDEDMFCLECVLIFDGIGGYSDGGDPGFDEIGVETG